MELKYQEMKLKKTKCKWIRMTVKYGVEYKNIIGELKHEY